MSGFQVYSAESTEGNGNTINYAELNQYVVDTADLKEETTLIGYISGIYDLGTQKLPDAEYKVDVGDENLTIGELTEKYKEKIEEGLITKFAVSYDVDTKSQMIKKFVPQRDRQAVCYSVDFPDVMIDKAKFFGSESSPKPLRLYIGGEWWDKSSGEMVINSLIPLKKTKDEKLGWTMHPRSALYKLAAASKVLPLEGSDLKVGTNPMAFQPEMIDKLLGKSLQFKAQVFFKEKDDKKYYNEKLSFVGALARGQNPYEDVDTTLIMFNIENDEQVLKGLPKHVINTMARATNFDGSVIQQQLVSVGRYTPKNPQEGDDNDYSEGIDEPESQEKTTENNSGTEDLGW